MAKSKRNDKKPPKGKKQHSPSRQTTKPLPGSLPVPTPTDPLRLSKNTAEIHREVVKIDKHRREILHELWPTILMGNVAQAESAIWRSIGSYKSGLTPQEVEVLKDVRQNLRAELDRLNVIYFRLKFWS